MPTLRAILVVDDESSIRSVLSLFLSEAGYDVRAVSDGAEALKELAARPYDAVVTDVRMPNVDGMELLEKALARWPDSTFLVTSAYGTQDLALRAVAAGAFDYIQKPFKPEAVVLALRKAEERLGLVRENRRLRMVRGGSLERLIGASDGMREVIRQIRKLAPVSTTVLVTGESGTGKELVAHALHELSPRAAMPFVAVNCSAIPAGLIESELFGHARGAFTDARVARRGLFTEADGGTLFLDEVAELPQEAQAKLLRVLQEGEVRPVGETRTELVDVRVVAATLRDLGKVVEQGGFRADLFYRLNVVNLAVPPLRARPADILPIARHFLGRFNRELNRAEPLQGFAPEAEVALGEYAWPGNVRELENAVERAVLLADSDWVGLRDLPDKLWSGGGRPSSPQKPQGPDDLSLKRAMRELEETYIRAALRRTEGNRTRAAELLELSHRALLYKIKEYGIDPDDP